MDIEKTKALVSGGTSGIGLEVARALVSTGAKVAIVGRRRDLLAQAEREIGVVSIHGDVADEASVESAVVEAHDKLGGLNALINNAGYGYFAPLLETSTEEFERLHRVNLLGAMMMAREAARYFVEQKFGNIVNIGSTAARKGFAGGSAYVSSKFGLRGMTECWQAELRKHNVRVTLVNPSEVITDFHRVAGVPQKDVERKLKPEDVARVILSVLAGEDRGFVTETTVWATNPWPDV